MYVVINFFFFIIITLLLLVGAFSSIQENLKKLLFYNILGQFSYIILLIFYIKNDLIDFEFLIIQIFFLLFNINLYISFFISILNMKRGGNSYKIKSIYDLAQLWISDKKITISFLIILFNIAGIPFFPGFLCKWFFVEEMFLFQKYLGIISLFSVLLMSFPFIRIINQMVFNKNLMSNPKGPRWYFDKLLTKYQVFLLGITIFICCLIIINPSILWYFSYYFIYK